MIYEEIIIKQEDKMLSLNVRKIDYSRIMIEGDKESLLFLSEYIRHHANEEGRCCADVPLNINLISGKFDENNFELFLHRLPCNEDM